MNRFTKSIAAAAAAVLLLAGCGGGGSADGGGTEGGEVVIGYQPGNTLALLKAQGTLEDRLEAEGYEVAWEELAIGTLVLEALNTGNIDFGHSSDANAIFSAANGKPIEYAASENPYPEGVALLSRADSGITTVADLEGTRIGVVEGGNMHYLLLRALEREGLSVDDVDVVYYANAADGMAAFRQGEFEVFGTWDPFLAIIQEQIETTTVLDAEGLADNRTFYFATPEFMENDPEILSIILEELQKSNQWANENSVDAAAILADELGLDPAPLETANERRDYGVLAMDDAAVQAQQDLADTFFDAGLIENEITVADYVDTEPTWIPENVK
ncbi:aliphatic sulfonate ABC transporter substrate-binding protein [Agrococcus casei]|uniref:aliphatic sulfonate ABC transporter substrate-binding protein n=1 Tax=Agrococcus casei TaxID=343512 RepID=UPI003F9242C2